MADPTPAPVPAPITPVPSTTVKGLPSWRVYPGKDPSGILVQQYVDLAEVIGIKVPDPVGGGDLSLRLKNGAFVAVTVTLEVVLTDLQAYHRRWWQ